MLMNKLASIIFSTHQVSQQSFVLVMALFDGANLK
jgi:hypothetical protein